MISGQEGGGTLPMAVALAQYLLCENPTQTDSCGQCPSCQKSYKLEHPDWRLCFPSIAPKPGSKANSKAFFSDFRTFFKTQPYASTFDWLQHIKAENKQGNITAEECRELIDELNLKSFEGGSKILMMWRPEFLGKEGNILLKMIEEPPANTFIIFACENPDEVLPTIRSRVQLYRLPPISPKDIAEELVRQNLTDEVKALQIGQLAKGSFQTALQLLSSDEHDYFPMVLDIFNAVFSNKGLMVVKNVEEFSKLGREAQRNFLNFVNQLIAYSIQWKYTQNSDFAINHHELDFVKKLSKVPLTISQYQQMTGEVDKTNYLIERNGNAKIQMMALLLRLNDVINN